MFIINSVKDRLFEITLFVVGLTGLLILFTLLYAGPRAIVKYVMGIF